MRDIISVGECMIELARRADGAFDLRVGGDTFNTAIYLARLGVPVAYLTAIGDDPYSARIIETARTENVDVDLIRIVDGRMPGLYLIETETGERSFWYWRDRSPARELFELPQAEALIDALTNARLIYLSGITLSLYSDVGLDHLEAGLTRARGNSARIVMDGNFRPAGWQHDPERARRTYARFWAHTDIALPSYDDEQALWGDTDPAETFARLHDFGVPEICLKMAGIGAIISTGDDPQHCPPQSTIQPVDSTAAGDSFNAGYLQARLADIAPDKATQRGNLLAAIVIQHPGAIVPADATAAFVANIRAGS